MREREGGEREGREREREGRERERVRGREREREGRERVRERERERGERERERREREREHTIMRFEEELRSAGQLNYTVFDMQRSFGRWLSKMSRQIWTQHAETFVQPSRHYNCTMMMTTTTMMTLTVMVYIS